MAASVPLAQVARIERVEGPVKVDHENAERMAVVQANVVRDRDLVGFVADAKQAAATLGSAPGYRLTWAASSRTSSAPPRDWRWWCRWRWR